VKHALAVVLILLAALAWADDTATPPPVAISMVAVKAARVGHEKTQYGPGLESVRPALRDSKYDDYALITKSRASAPYGRQTQLRINSQYTLVITPESRERDGGIRADIRVEMAAKKPGDRPVNVISAKGVLAPGKPLRLGGPKVDNGDLIVILIATQ